MTPTQQEDTRERHSAVVSPDNNAQLAGNAPTSRHHQEIIHGRSLNSEGAEAYLRSAREQAAIDIAAGW